MGSPALPPLSLRVHVWCEGYRGESCSWGMCIRLENEPQALDEALPLDAGEQDMAWKRRFVSSWAVLQPAVLQAMVPLPRFRNQCPAWPNNILTEP